MRKFNYVYSKLIKNDADIVGQIAYSLYKKHKIEYIKEFYDKHGKDPTDEELQVFHNTSNEQRLLNSYKIEAKNILTDFTDYLYDEAKPQIESDYAQKMPCKQNSFWTGVYQSVVGSFFFILIIGLLTFISWSANRAPKQIIENIFNIEITDRK